MLYKFTAKLHSQQNPLQQMYRNWKYIINLNTEKDLETENAKPPHNQHDYRHSETTRRQTFSIWSIRFPIVVKHNRATHNSNIKHIKEILDNLACQAQHFSVNFSSAKWRCHIMAPKNWKWPSGRASGALQWPWWCANSWLVEEKGVAGKCLEGVTSRRSAARLVSDDVMRTCRPTLYYNVPPKLV